MPPKKYQFGEPTQQDAREHIDYFPDTGKMVWRLPGPRRRVGAEVGWVMYKGYRIFQFWNKTHSVHRFAFFWMEGLLIPEDMVVDHINLDRSDNRWGNLRIATLSENQLNTERYGDMRGIQDRGNNTYRIRLNIDGVRTNLTVRGSLDDAVRARDDLAARRGGIRGSLS